MNWTDTLSYYKILLATAPTTAATRRAAAASTRKALLQTLPLEAEVSISRASV
jgi:hypothetical protein